MSGARIAHGGEQTECVKIQIVHVFKMVVHMAIGSVLTGNARKVGEVNG